MSSQARPWHDRHMTALHEEIAQGLSRLHSPESCLLRLGVTDLDESHRWRLALRQAGVPVLELNEAATGDAEAWLKAAGDFSAEFLMPVVVLGGDASAPTKHCSLEGEALAEQHHVKDAEWLRTRQVALTRAVETSPLNQEFRRHRERRGWIRMGWQAEASLAEGNGLLLAWSSPLPLRRIRDFAARCPDITLVAPDAEALAAEVAAQGISVSGWRFAVK